jgi:hypothetical protein
MYKFFLNNFQLLKHYKTTNFQIEKKKKISERKDSFSYYFSYSFSLSFTSTSIIYFGKYR